VAAGAGVTVAAIRTPVEEAGSFGVIEADRRGRIQAFREKPSDPVGLPDAPHQVLASMGNYIFTTEALVRAVTTDAADEGSHHDIGGDIIPRMVAGGDAVVYDFGMNDVPGATDRDRGYWRDVGTLDSYYSANMDLISVQPVFNLYNMSWPIYSWNSAAPPAKLVFEDDHRRGQAFDSMLCAGTIVSGGTVRGSILSSDVRVHSGGLVEGSVILQGVQVGRGAVVRRAIIDKNVVIPPDASIGVNLDEEAARLIQFQQSYQAAAKMLQVAQSVMDTLLQDIRYALRVCVRMTFAALVRHRCDAGCFRRKAQHVQGVGNHRFVWLVRAIPFEHCEFRRMQRPALAIAEHAGEIEDLRFARCEQLLTGKFRRSVEIELAPFARGGAQLRLEGVQVELQQTLPFELVKRGTTASPSPPQNRANKPRHRAIA